MRLALTLIHSYLLASQCLTLECQVKAALVINILKFLDSNNEVNFCFSDRSEIRDLLKLAFDENKGQIRNVRLVEKHYTHSSNNEDECQVVFRDKAFEGKALDVLENKKVLVIQNGDLEGEYTIKLKLIDGKMRLIINRSRFVNSPVKIDPSILNLAYKIIN